MRAHRGTIDCRDCGARVAELKEHRVVCPNSRKNKSAVSSNKRSRGSVADGTTAFVLIDVSGSMGGPRLDAAKEAVSACFAAMNDADRFSVVTFDTSAFFKLKPRPVEQLRRQNELPAILSRIFARGGTALYDAIFMTAEQIHNKAVRNTITVLTDGEDNSSKHTLADVLALLSEYPNIALDIVHIDGSNAGRVPAFDAIVAGGRGQYVVVQTVEVIVETTTKVFTQSYVVKQ
jgi:uncharacterized protein with von Willebrand factor type A (vWA) domain